MMGVPFPTDAYAMRAPSSAEAMAAPEGDGAERAAQAQAPRGATAASTAESLAGILAALRTPAERRQEADVDTIFGVVAGPMIEVFAGAQAEGLAGHFASHPDLGARVEAAEAADQLQGRPWRPALEDADWIALKEICAD